MKCDKLILTLSEWGNSHFTDLSKIVMTEFCQLEMSVYN